MNVLCQKMTTAFWCAAYVIRSVPDQIAVALPLVIAQGAVKQLWLMPHASVAF
jgi:hypothetical protein